MRLVIREAVPGDAETIARVTRDAFASQCALYADPDLPPMSDSGETVLEVMRRGATVLVAEVDGAVVGSVRGELTDSTCSVGRLVVDPGHQGRGIGRALALAVEAAFPDAKRFEIFTGHRSAGPLHLYESLGYARESERVVHDRLTLVFLAKPGPAGHAPAAWR